MLMRALSICLVLMAIAFPTIAVSDAGREGGVYAILEITVHDEETYQEYRQQVKPIIENYGGRYVVRAGTKFVSDNPTSAFLATIGDWAPDRLIVLHFESAKRYQEFLDAPEYKKIVHLRTSSSSTKAVLVRAFQPDE